MARIELSNIGGGGTTLSLTTTGTSGAATLAGSVLNIPIYQGQLTLTTTGTSGAATLSGDILNIPQYSGGGTPAGSAGQVQFNSTPAGSFAASTAFVFDTSGPFLKVGAAAPSATVGVNGAGTTSATTSLHVRNSSSVDLLKVNDNGQLLLGKNGAGATQSTASIEVSTSDTNTNIAIVPKGTGAITAAIPDAGITGGNSRGTYAVDLQMSRANANQVASSNLSTISGGRDNRVASEYSTICGGRENTITTFNYATIAGGYLNSSQSNYGFIGAGLRNSTTGGVASAVVVGGADNISAADYSFLPGGQFGRSYLYGQGASASGRFGASGAGDAQTSNIRLRRSITGTAATELFLDGASLRAILPLPTGATNGRLWNAIVQLSAICTTAGGTVTVGESFIGTYNLGIKRIGANTSLVGTVQNMITAQADTNMASSVVTITADDTNESLKIEFTPPTGANASTVIRVVATVYLTEVGY